MSMFKKATKEQSRLRLALFGPSGAGKTFTALRVAAGMGGRVAVIDTERGSASKYADRFEFDVADLENHSIESYVSTMNEACKAGYNVLIIDSLSHAWHQLLEEVDKITTSSRHRGNKWSAWSEATPKHRNLIEAILRCDAHIIATMRSKTEWATESENGKTKPVRVGLSPEQRSGMEYEFDMLMEISVDHVATIIKDRTGKFQDQNIDKPGEDFGKALAEWLTDGAAPQPKPQPQPQTTTNGNGTPPKGPVDQIADEEEAKRKAAENKAFLARITNAYPTLPDAKRDWITEHVAKVNKSKGDQCGLIVAFANLIAEGDDESVWKLICQWSEYKGNCLDSKDKLWKASEGRIGVTYGKAKSALETALDEALAGVEGEPDNDDVPF